VGRQASALCRGRTDPDCLSLIDQVFPGSQFIHVVRDGREVVAPIVSKNWVGFDEAVDVWGRHVLHARYFGRLVGPDRYLEISYEDLVEEGPAIANRVQDFLALAPSQEVREFIQEQAIERTPFSRPTVEDLGHPGKKRLDRHARARSESALQLLLIECGYIQISDLIGQDDMKVSGPA
jgi:hypothetical protein